MFVQFPLITLSLNCLDLLIPAPIHSCESEISGTKLFDTLSIVLLHKRSYVYILSFHLSTHLERRAARVSWHDCLDCIHQFWKLCNYYPSSVKKSTCQCRRLADELLLSPLLQDYYPGDGCRCISLFHVFSWVCFLRKTKCCYQREAEYKSTPLMRVLMMKRRRDLILCLSGKKGYWLLLIKWRENSVTLSQFN